jgi:hypothetical protein
VQQSVGLRNSRGTISQANEFGPPRTHPSDRQSRKADVAKVWEDPESKLQLILVARPWPKIVPLLDPLGGIRAKWERATVDRLPSPPLQIRAGARQVRFRLPPGAKSNRGHESDVPELVSRVPASGRELPHASPRCLEPFRRHVFNGRRGRHIGHGMGTTHRPEGRTEALVSAPDQVIFLT